MEVVPKKERTTNKQKTSTSSVVKVTKTTETVPTPRTDVSTSITEVQVTNDTIVQPQENAPIEETPIVPAPPSTDIVSQEQALETISQFLNNDDIGFIIWEENADSFVFKAQSKSVATQGGTGTIGFYRVNKNGNIDLLDAAT